MNECHCSGNDNKIPSIDPMTRDYTQSTPDWKITQEFQSLTARQLFNNGTGYLENHVFFLKVPPQKNLSYLISHGAHYEVGVKISANDYPDTWRRNSYEGGAPPELVPPVEFERLFKFEGLFKRCWVTDVPHGRCSSRPWNPCPGSIIHSESGSVNEEYHVEIWWDDSRNPPQYHNIFAQIRVW